nr:hypothetical protein [Clostridium sp. SHJSY1]
MAPVIVRKVKILFSFRNFNKESAFVTIKTSIEAYIRTSVNISLKTNPSLSKIKDIDKVIRKIYNKKSLKVNAVRYINPEIKKI